MPEQPLRVAYILKMFPRLSETFILNEVLELERRGVQVSVTSLMLPNEGRFHGRLSDLGLTVDYLPRDSGDRHWTTLRELPDEVVPPMERWQEPADFVKCYQIPRELSMLLRAVILAARYRRDGVQHIHAHFGTIATRLAAMVSMLSGIPYSFTAHAKDIFRETVNRDLFRELVDRSAFCITVSDFNRRFIIENTPGVDADKVIRLYNGLDLEVFTPPAERPVPEVPHVLSVGRLVPKKGFPHLLRAVRLCLDAGQPLKVTVVGGGDERERLHALRAELGLEDVVDLAGALPQERVRELLSEVSMMALACVPDPDGNKDALPTVLLEALAYDLPIVSTTLTGIPEIVGDDAGLLVEPGDDEGLAASIQSLWAKIRAGEVGAGVARARAERLFDERQNVGELVGHFERSARQGAQG